MKLVYEVASDRAGLHSTRLCAAGLLMVLTSPTLRRIALRHLKWLETGKNAPKDESQTEAYLELTNHVDFSLRYNDHLDKELQKLISDFDANRSMHLPDQQIRKLTGQQIRAIDDAAEEQALAEALRESGGTPPKPHHKTNSLKTKGKARNTG